jgi:nucleoside-diphosphate-sugar epimerase
MQRRRRTVLLTGGTGFVGSHLAVELMRGGVFVVFLTRPKRGRAAHHRVEEVLRWHGHTEASTYEVHDGDFTQPWLGLAPDAYADLAGKCDEVWHCASDTSFSERKRSLLARVNVEGTRQMVAFAAHSRAEMVNYVSTCYAVGRVAGRCEERLTAQTEFHNPYEETKYAAERLLVDECTRAGLPHLIYRPSIIIGDSRSGRTLIFNGLYYPLRVLDYLRGLVLADIGDSGGHNARDLGAGLAADGRVVMPLRVAVDNGEKSQINVVPIDYVTHGCLALREHGRPGSVYHLVGDEPVQMGALVDLVTGYMGISGVTVTTTNAFRDTETNALERQFSRSIDVYLPYMNDVREFAADTTTAVLARHGVTCPTIDRPLLERCVAYARQVGWTTPLAT